MRYKVGDVVRLRSDLVDGEEYGCNVFVLEMEGYKGKPLEIVDIYKIGYEVEVDDEVREYNITDEMIEGLWEECKPSEQVEKDNEHILDAWRYAVESKPKVKLKLIDILNKIANGELKEGTKVKYKDIDLIYEDEELVDDEGFSAADFFRSKADYNEEVELIEPQEPTECEHEWEEYGMYNTKTKEDKHFRKCIKCDLEEEIEPTDNTKIEELKTYENSVMDIFHKLNEVIRKLNKED